MNRQMLIIDNAGFDVQAMAEMTETEFVTLFLENDAIAPNRTEEKRVKYLKDCHAAIMKAAAPPAQAKPKRSSPGK